ncbi:hypothetical protein K4L44_16030 [Halosquirtibacter laminarini]|uniref:Uncharacterized protein n=1 Tax=Halosquirtibacter laminarini TaxID=3374600 RepID=A0AC61NN78_9BACT|nr:hypothetical protein K4L44_16030 [Prolixibacteraceae bacterium]
MRTKHIITCLLLLTTIWRVDAKDYTIGNKFIQRSFELKEGIFSSKSIRNKQKKEKLITSLNYDFQLRLSKDVDIDSEDTFLTNKDFICDNIVKEDKYTLTAYLKNEEHGLEIEIHYNVSKEDPFIRKYLKIKTTKEITLERIDVDILKNKDIFQPYKERKITSLAPAQWKPGLGQPLYAKKTGLFLGVEFPASYNFVQNTNAYCGYLQGKVLHKNTTYTSYKAVIGSASKDVTLQRAFFAYIDKSGSKPKSIRHTKDRHILIQ